MNIFNSKALLLGVFLFFLLVPLSGWAPKFTDSIPESKKELIIVSIDESLMSNIGQLATYIESKFEHTEGDVIRIKTYLHPEDDCSMKKIDVLIQLLVDKGISRSTINIQEGGQFLNHPYFSLALVQNPGIQ